MENHYFQDKKIPADIEDSKPCLLYQYTFLQGICRSTLGLDSIERNLADIEQVLQLDLRSSVL
jgi:hypothetical protein